VRPAAGDRVNPVVRMWRHVIADFGVRRAFPRTVLDSIERAITAQEQRHSGELRFAVEGSLSAGQLLAGQDARARAIDVFSELRVWDTEHNCGVLIYVLLGDRAVEIVADRGIERKVGRKDWEAICRDMEKHFSRGDFERGALTGLEKVGQFLALHFPPSADDTNELPDRPVVL
jgi:hypothetical protein